MFALDPVNGPAPTTGPALLPPPPSQATGCDKKQNTAVVAAATGKQGTDRLHLYVSIPSISALLHVAVRM